MKTAKTALVLFVSWAVILVLLVITLNEPKFTLRDGLIAGAILVVGYWFIVTGRLRRLFRKV